MKRHSHIRSLLLPWLELRLKEPQRLEVEGHLKDCSACRQYFEAVSRVLVPASDSPKDTLEVDPYLVTRVQAIGLKPASAMPGTFTIIRRWTLRSALFVVAVVFGIYMGEKLSYQPTVITDQKIIAEFSAALDASGIGDRLQTVALSSGEVSK